eukprot:403370502
MILSKKSKQPLKIVQKATRCSVDDVLSLLKTKYDQQKIEEVSQIHRRSDREQIQLSKRNITLNNQSKGIIDRSQSIEQDKSQSPKKKMIISKSVQNIKPFLKKQNLKQRQLEAFNIINQGVILKIEQPINNQLHTQRGLSLSKPNLFNKELTLPPINSRYISNENSYSRKNQINFISTKCKISFKTVQHEEFDIENKGKIDQDLLHILDLSKNSKSQTQTSQFLDSIVAKRQNQGYQKFSTSKHEQKVIAKNYGNLDYPIKLNRDLVDVNINNDLQDPVSNRNEQQNLKNKMILSKKSKQPLKIVQKATRCSVDDVLSLLKTKYDQQKIEEVSQIHRRSDREQIQLSKRNITLNNQSKGIIDRSQSIEQDKSQSPKKKMIISKSVQNIKPFLKKQNLKQRQLEAFNIINQGVILKIEQPINNQLHTQRGLSLSKPNLFNKELTLPPINSRYISNENSYSRKNQINFMQEEQLEQILNSQLQTNTRSNIDSTQFNSNMSEQLLEKSFLQVKIDPPSVKFHSRRQSENSERVFDTLEPNYKQEQIEHGNNSNMKSLILKNKGKIDQDLLHILDLYKVKGQSFVPTTDTEIEFFKKSLNKNPIKKKKVSKFEIEASFHNKRQSLDLDNSKSYLDIHQIFKASKIDEKYNEFMSKMIAYKQEDQNIPKIYDEQPHKFETHRGDRYQVHEEKSLLLSSEKKKKKIQVNKSVARLKNQSVQPDPTLELNNYLETKKLLKNHSKIKGFKIHIRQKSDLQTDSYFTELKMNKFRQGESQNNQHPQTHRNLLVSSSLPLLKVGSINYRNPKGFQML